MAGPSGATPILGLPYPAPGDTVDVPRDIQALATAVEQKGSFIVGEVRIFGFITPLPRWLPCDGALKDRLLYPELFSAISTIWNTGGEAGTVFRLPDLRGRAPVGSGQGAAPLTNRTVGDRFGSELYTLKTGEAAQKAVSVQAETTDHTHGSGNGYPFQTTRLVTGLAADAGAQPGWFPDGYTGATTGRSSSHTHAINGSDAVSGHPNVQPSLATLFCIYAGRV